MNIMSPVKVDPLNWKIPSITFNEFTSYGYDDVTKTSHKNWRRKSWSLKKKICGFTFVHAWNSETVPWKSTRNWNLYMEHRSCSYDSVCRWVRPSPWYIDWSRQLSVTSHCDMLSSLVIHAIKGQTRVYHEVIPSSLSQTASLPQWPDRHLSDKGFQTDSGLVSLLLHVDRMFFFHRIAALSLLFSGK